MKAITRTSAAALAVLAAGMFLVSCGNKTRKSSQEAAEVAVEEAVQDLDAQYATDMLKPGTPAPSFTLKDPQGNEVALEDFKGRYVVLDFWASWCPDCRADVPRLKELYKEYSSDKVAFLSVSFDTDKDKWTSYIEENDMPWAHVSPLAKWKETQVSKDYSVKWIPSMYLIGPDGKVVLGTVMLEKVGEALAGIKG